MRSVWFILCVLLHLCATPAVAGAWLKDKGSGFTSVSFSMTWFRDTSQQSYLEFGLRDDLTVGYDAGLAQSRFGTLSGYALVFGRRAIGADEGPNRFAYEVGIGAAWVDAVTTPILKTGLSWGRGFSFEDRGGWAAVDASVTWDIGVGQHLGKVDTTVGLALNDRLTGMLQVYTAYIDGKTFATVAPSIIVSPWKEKGKFRIQIGTETEISNSENTAIKIGLWREF